MINSSDGDEEHNPGQTEREHDMYDRLDETKNFSVADGFVSFTRTVKYLGSLISYNLCDDDNSLQGLQLQMPQWVPRKNYGATPILTCTTNTSFFGLFR
jgi:hypothetical protein